MYFFYLLFKDCIVTFDYPIDYCLTGDFSGDFISPTSSMNNAAALLGERMMNLRHIVLIALVLVEDNTKGTSMLGVEDVSSLGIKEVVSTSS
jgi:hypothetical protein